jgi:hypothetical protein
MPKIYCLNAFLDASARVPHMKIRPSRAAEAPYTGKPPRQASLPIWPKHKGTIIWLAVTAGCCIAVIVAFQGIDAGIGIALAVVIAIAALILKLATPRLRARTEDKRIAAIKAKQEASRASGARGDDGLASTSEPVSHPVDASQLKATDGFALMHMGPPEVIDLDLTRGRDKRGKVPVDGPALDDQKNLAVEKAIELEDSGAIDKAIVQYGKALALARQLGRDDEAISFENRIKQLKQEKGRS